MTGLLATAIAILGLLASGGSCQHACHAAAPKSDHAAAAKAPSCHGSQDAGQHRAPAPAEPCSDDCSGCSLQAAVDRDTLAATTTSARIAIAIAPDSPDPFRGPLPSPRQDRLDRPDPPRRDVLSLTSTLRL